MSTNETLSKLKLTELRKMCKGSSKSAIGSKVDLIQRLLETSVENQIPTITPEDEAELLGDPDQTTVESDEELDVSINAPTQQKSSKRALCDDEDMPTKKLREDESGNVEDTSWDTNDDGVIVTLTDEDRKAKRAERFQLPTNGSGSESKTGLSDERLVARAKRFGIPIGEPQADPDKLKSRAERFGLPVSIQDSIIDSDEKMAKRRERFNIPESLIPVSAGANLGGALSSTDKMAQRAKRFGIASVSPVTVDSPVSVVSEDEAAAKLKAREERFGIVKISAPS